jgi:hypothetical protein
MVTQYLAFLFSCGTRPRAGQTNSEELSGTPLLAWSLCSGIGKWPSPRPISTGQLKRSPFLHLRPINQLVSLGPYPVNPVRVLILRWASHLDAFSAYPIRTWLPGGAPGGTTGALEVRSTRSSRTEVNSSQDSYAHGG